MDKLVARYYRTRSTIWRYQRLLFPSAAEVRFITIMGGRVWQVRRLKLYKNRQPFTIVLSLGRLLKDEHFKREVRIGKYFMDFCNDLNMIIEIDGQQYHDILEDQKRDEYIRSWCYNYAPKEAMEARIIRVPASRLWNSSAKVQRDILLFLTR